MSLLVELKRRRVFRALVGYGIAAFAVLQIIEPVLHGMRWPDAVLSYVVVGLAIGFPVVVALAWIFDVSGESLERTRPASLGGWRSARVVLLLAGLGVLSAAPGLIWYFFVRGAAKPDRAFSSDQEINDVKFNPFFRKLQSDPRWAVLLDKMKLPPG